TADLRSGIDDGRGPPPAGGCSAPPSSGPVSGRLVLAAAVFRSYIRPRGGHLAGGNVHASPGRARAALHRPWHRSDVDLPPSASLPASPTGAALAQEPAH